MATAAALGYSTLQNAILAFESQVDHRGKKIMQTPMTLLVPPALEYKALELLETVGHPGERQQHHQCCNSGSSLHQIGGVAVSDFCHRMVPHRGQCSDSHWPDSLRTGGCAVWQGRRF